MKKFLFALALLMCASIVSLVASDLSDAKRSLKSAQKELSSVISKRDKAQKKQNELQADYEEALAKMIANQDKPKSLAYKDAVKKSESLPAKLEQNAQLLASLNRQVDSLNNVVVGCESALNQVQEAESSEVVEEVESNEEEPVVAAITDPALQPVEKEDPSDAIVLNDDNCGAENEASEEKSPSSSKPTTFWGKVWLVIKIIFWIFIGIIVLRILMKIGGRSGGSSSSSSRSSSRSSSSSSSSGSSDKQRKIADKQAEIARCQEKIVRLQDSMRSRKRNRVPYRDLEMSISIQKQRIASLRGDIARIRAGKL